MINNRALSLALSALLAGASAVVSSHAQQGPSAGPPAPMAGHRDDKMMMHKGGPEGAMGILPPGTWWRNPTTIAALTLTADQQKKLDDTFLQSRIGLIHLHASLEEEQLKLEPLLNANPPDQAKSLAEISKIADLRADLEKADAKMLLSLRGVLTADQWTKLQAEQHAHHGNPESKDKGGDHKRGQGGPSGQQGPRGGNMPPPPPGAELEQ